MLSQTQILRVHSTVPDESDCFHGHLRIHTPEWFWREDHILSHNPVVPHFQPLFNRRVLPKQRRPLPSCGQDVSLLDIFSGCVNCTEHTHFVDICIAREANSSPTGLTRIH